MGAAGRRDFHCGRSSAVGVRGPGARRADVFRRIVDTWILHLCACRHHDGADFSAASRSPSEQTAPGRPLDIVPSAPRLSPTACLPAVEKVQTKAQQRGYADQCPEVRFLSQQNDRRNNHNPFDNAKPDGLCPFGKRHLKLTPYSARYQSSLSAYASRTCWPVYVAGVRAACAIPGPVELSLVIRADG